MSARSTVASVLGVALILVGISFLGFGLATALTPILGIAGGAAVTGLVLVLPPLLWALIKAPARAAADAPRTTVGYETLLISELSRLANKKPLFAVLIAVMTGAASSILRKT